MRKLVIVALLAALMVSGGCSEKLNLKKFTFRKKKEITISCSSCLNEINNMSGRCIATYYQEDGDKYITEQEHLVCFCDNAFYVSSFEPDGEMIGRCGNNTGFGIIKGVAGEEIFLNKEICQAIHSLLIGNLDLQSSVFSSTMVNMYGQWYTEISSTSSNIKKYLSMDSNLVDMAEVYRTINDKLGKAYVGKAFDYIEVEGVKLPRVVEIFESGGEKVLGRKIIKLDYSEFSVK